MSEYDPREYSFLGLYGHGRQIGPVTSLAYLVGLVPSADNGIAEPGAAGRILSYFFDIEEQVTSAEKLLVLQKQFLSRFSADGYRPLTPAMLTLGWSPIGAMVQNGLEPITLRRAPGIKAVATGIWRNISIQGARPIDKCETDEALFWAILNEASRRALEQRHLVSVVSKPGWAYETNKGLPSWPGSEIQKADRILWKRVP